MTRVRLPPDPENSCITTIVDSQGGDAALISVVANMSTTATTSTTTTDGDGSVGGSSGDNNMSIERGGIDNVTIASSPSASVSMATTNPGSTFLGGANNNSHNTNESITALRSFSSSARSSGMGGIENVDSIILIYDLDRDETFFRLENHWLPLIERCYNGGVSTM